jgi:hypothetical protein
VVNFIHFNGKTFVLKWMKPHGLVLLHTCVMSKGEPYPVVVNKKSMVPCKTTRGLFKHEVPSLHERE